MRILKKVQFWGVVLSLLLAVLSSGWVGAYAQTASLQLVSSASSASHTANDRQLFLLL